MREIILDTETTGLEPSQGHRVVEIGALELVNHIPSGRTFHVYINPQRDMPREAEAVHGLSAEFLKDKPVFGEIIDEFEAFIADSALVIHNAGFDLAFLNAEFSRLNVAPIASDRVVDTLHLARKKHPTSSNSLDALCKRYGVDASRRTKHGALLDSELLADVYLELIGGRQTALTLASSTIVRRADAAQMTGVVGPRPHVLPQRITGDEREAHAAFVEQLGDGAIWKAV